MTENHRGRRQEHLGSAKAITLERWAAPRIVALVCPTDETNSRGQTRSHNPLLSRSQRKLHKQSTVLLSHNSVSIFNCLAATCPPPPPSLYKVHLRDFQTHYRSKLLGVGDDYFSVSRHFVSFVRLTEGAGG